VKNKKKHSHQGDTSVGLSLYMALEDVKKLLKANLGDTKTVKKLVDGLFKRMQKHLKHNEILQQSMWRKITDFFMKRFKKVKIELERAYRVNELVPVKEVEVYELFEQKNMEAFKVNFDETSSVGSSSIGASSVASSAITGITKITSTKKIMNKENMMGHGSSHGPGSVLGGRSTGGGSSVLHGHNTGLGPRERDSPSLSSKGSGRDLNT